MRYKAIFFDRDGTLAYKNPKKSKWFKDMIESWSGREFNLSYDKMIHLLDKAANGRDPWFRTIDEEETVFKQYYKLLLHEEGIKNNIDEKALLLFDEMWCSNSMILYDEVIDVLEYFKNNGYKIGVISDTGPSLKKTLTDLKISQYFSSFTLSSVVGVMKPDPRKFVC